MVVLTCPHQPSRVDGQSVGEGATMPPIWRPGLDEAKRRAILDSGRLIPISPRGPRLRRITVRRDRRWAGRAANHRGQPSDTTNSGGDRPTASGVRSSIATRGTQGAASRGSAGQWSDISVGCTVAPIRGRCAALFLRVPGLSCRGRTPRQMRPRGTGARPDQRRPTAPRRSRHPASVFRRPISAPAAGVASRVP